MSGSKGTRPALDEMMAAARRRRVDTIVVWKLDRLGRSLRHLILTLEELAGLGVAFVSLGEGIDTSTAARRLQLHILGAMAKLERGRVAKGVGLGLARARRDGQRLGRPRLTNLPDSAPRGLTVRDAAIAWGVSKSTAARRLAARCVPNTAEHVAALSDRSSI